MEDRRRLTRILVPTVVVGTAALLLLANLGNPGRIIFDEVYYVNDARDILEFGVEQGFVVHPPLGKLLIAVSIWLFGDSPFGWRALGGIAGTGTVLLTYLMGRRLFQRVAPAALAALLVAVDGAFIVQARTAMLDIHLAFFVALGAWFLVVHLDRTREADEAWLAADPGPHDHLPRRDGTFLALAGIALGLAVGVKWSGLLAVGGAGLVMIGAELARRRRVLGRAWRRPWRGVALIGVALVALPAAVYVLTWVPWATAYENSYEAGRSCDEPADCASAPLPARAAALWRFHGRMARFHADLQADHSYRAPAYTWPVLARPVVYYYETCSENRQNRAPKTDDDGEVTIPEPCIVERGEAAEMLAVGNPALWWTFLVSAVLLVGGLVRRDRRAAIVLAFVAAQFLPWLIVSRPVFSFYAVPLIPFVALGLATSIAMVGERRPVAGTLVGGSVGAIAGTAVALLWQATGGQPTRAGFGLFAALGAALGAAGGTWFFQKGEARRDAPVPDGPHASTEDANAQDANAGDASAQEGGDGEGGDEAGDDTPRTHDAEDHGPSVPEPAQPVTPPRPLPQPTPAWSRTGTWLLVGVTVVAVGLALFFLPIWLGIPLDDDTIRLRWWFRGWI